MKKTEGLDIKEVIYMKYSMPSQQMIKTQRRLLNQKYLTPYNIYCKVVVSSENSCDKSEGAICYLGYMADGNGSCSVSP